MQRNHDPYEGALLGVPESEVVTLRLLLEVLVLIGVQGLAVEEVQHHFAHFLSHARVAFLVAVAGDRSHGHVLDRHLRDVHVARVLTRPQPQWESDPVQADGVRVALELLAVDEMDGNPHVS